MLLEVIAFLASIASGLAQLYPGFGIPPMPFGPGPALLPGSRGPGEFYPMPNPPPFVMPRYMPNFFPAAPQQFPSMPYGLPNSGINPGPMQMSVPAMVPLNEQQSNENANTNVNINSASFRRSLHRPSKESTAHNNNKNTNTNSNLNV